MASSNGDINRDSAMDCDGPITHILAMSAATAQGKKGNIDECMLDISTSDKEQRNIEGSGRTLFAMGELFCY